MDRVEEEAVAASILDDVAISADAAGKVPYTILRRLAVLQKNAINKKGTCARTAWLTEPLRDRDGQKYLLTLEADLEARVLLVKDAKPKK